MIPVYVTYGALISPLGETKEMHVLALKANQSGIRKVEKSGFNGEDWYLAKIEGLSENRFDQLFQKGCAALIQSVGKDILSSPSTRIILSSTKANLSAVETDAFDSMRRLTIDLLAVAHEPIVISNACVSGVLAINTAADLIRTEKCDDVIVIGVDAVFDFVVFGFQSLFAMSDEPCRPFDKHRKGISLGEGFGSVWLSRKQHNDFCVRYLAGSSSNDANHISGPSRTGEGLYRAVKRTLLRAERQPTAIDFISAHGTGTLYNDDMESVAFNRLQMQHIPVNSFKGYFGHTLGAAGVIETYTSLLSMEYNLLFKNEGALEPGTAETINVLTQNQQQKVTCVLKTASGFGGGNAAFLMEKLDA